MIKGIGSGDIHYCPERKADALASLGMILTEAIARRPHIICIPGDLYDRSIKNNDKDGLPELIDIIQKLMDIAPVVAVMGTSPSHDSPGCYDVFTQIKAAHPFVLLQPGKVYGLYRGNINEIDPEPGLTNIDALIFGIPEASKAMFLSGSNGISKDEANERIKTGLREILLGYGAVRKNYPSIPAILLYHGLINGSTTGAGQVLTGDIAVGRDDLALSGADLVLCAHIHEPQKVADRIYYTGSAYPVDWAETTQRTFISFEIIGGGPAPARFDGEATFCGLLPFEAKVQHVPFPHAPRKKITFDADDINVNVDANEYIGFQVWYDIRGRQKNGFNCETFLQCILNDGALPGSRVTFTEIPTETVRAVEIQGVKALPEKIEVWAKNSELEVRDSVLEKAALLDAQARKSGILPQPHAWRLRKVRTRGLKGVWRGMGLDEYEIDFDRFDPGLIALVAENGTGKTTMMLNCHMYPSMLTFDKKLQDYFRLRDSYREVYAVDELTGTEYRARMLIDGKNASGKAEYYLDRMENGVYVPVTSGKTKDYEDKIVELFGSEGLYLRSAFIPSKPSPRYPDLSYVAQGEKKRIFYELSGIGFYATYNEKAKTEAKTLRVLIESGETLISHAADLPEKIEQLSISLCNLQGQVLGNTILLEEIETEGKTAKAEVERLAATVKTNDEIEAKTTTLEGEIFKTQLELGGWENKLNTAKSFTTPEGEAKRKNAVADLEDADKLKEQVQSWTEDVAKRRKERAEIVDANNQAVKEYHDKQVPITEKIAEMKSEIKTLQADKTIKLAAVDRFQDELEKLKDLTVCPTCGLTLPPEKQEAFVIIKSTTETGLKQHQNFVFNLDKKIAECNRTIETETKNLAALQVPEEPDLEEIDKLIHFSETEAQNGKKLLAAIDIEAAKAIVKAADEARAGIVEAENQIKTLSEKIAVLSREIREFASKIDANADKLHTDAKAKYEDAKTRYTDTRAEIASAQGKIDTLTIEIEDKRKREAEIKTLKAEIETQKAELRDWEFLAEACGIDGIPALELDAVAPEISAAANALLESAYGQRFQIEFRTTKIAGTGSKKKQVEDFTIWIKDAQNGWEQPYETLSGGEETWIKKAISDAFELIKSKNTGVKMLTVFQDELDGKLSPHNRQVFFKLLEKTHEQTGRHHTVVVTHSEAVQEQIAQRIEMRKAVPV